MNHHKLRSSNPLPTTITTNSATSASTTTTTTTTTSKKKFGKNFNKLIKQQQQQQQPAVPAINGLNSRSLSYHRSNSSSSGGTSSLVLLSTKKKRSTSGIGIGIGNNAAGGSILSSGSNISSGSASGNHNGTTSGGSSSGIVNGTSGNGNGITMTTSSSLDNGSKETTTHDALVNALNGNNYKSNANGNGKGDYFQTVDSNTGHTTASDSHNYAAPVPVAWGVEKAKKKQYQHQQPHNEVRNETSDGTSYSKQQQKQHQDQYQNETTQPSSEPTSTTNDISTSKSTQPVSSSASSSSKNDNDDDQVEFMKKLAKQKAMKARQEEENRIKQQKERAALRLKELELKMAKKNGTSNSGAGIQNDKRSLFDPSSSSIRTYSSLVGNHNSNNNSQDNSNANGNVPTTNNISHHDNGSHLNGPSMSYQQQHQHQQQSPPLPSEGAMHMIHLSSYEDRDRGMVRNVNAGPRMLFDPKSGSMVAVSSRDKDQNGAGNGDHNGSGNGDRERGGSSKGGRREKGKLKSSRLRKDLNSVDDDGLDGKTNKLRNKSKKEKRREEKKATNSASSFERRKKTITSSAIERNGTGNGNKVRLPRTKGVLYKRDGKGNLVSADGCEGDQGYGAHSVPGGRIKNPKSYATKKKKLQEESDKQVRNYSETHGNQGFAGWHQQYDQYDYTAQPSIHMEYDPIQSKTLNRSHFMRKTNSPVKESHERVEKKEEISINFPSPLHVKADEKLELLTGMDESPTLQATAAAWAPSEAALALAAANANQNEKDSNSKSSDDMSETEAMISGISLIDNSTHEDEEESQSLRYGLGFDPTKDMDAVMMSPDLLSADNQGSNSTTNIPELIFKPDTSITTSSKNPFAADNVLLGSSPWGSNVPNSVSMGSLTNWGVGNKESSIDMSPSNSGKESSLAKSFLSLGNLNGDQNTWGTGGFSGFNGIDGPLFGSNNTQGGKD